MAIRDRGPAGLNPDPAAGAAELPTRRVDHGAEPPAAGGDHATTNRIQGVEARLVARMSESLGVPTATSFREIDVAMLEAERARLNEALAPRRLSYTHLLGYAVAQAVAVHPPMAAFYREIDGRPHRIEPARIGLGLAVDVEQRDGTRLLVVLVLYEHARHRRLLAAWHGLKDPLRLVLGLTAGRPTADHLATIEGHEDIVSAVAKGDADACVEATRAHLDRAVALVVAYIHER